MQPDYPSSHIIEHTILHTVIPYLIVSQVKTHLNDKLIFLYLCTNLSIHTSDEFSCNR